MSRLRISGMLCTQLMGAAARRRAAFNARAAQLAAPQEPAWAARGGAHGPGMAGANGLAAQQRDIRLAALDPAGAARSTLTLTTEHAMPGPQAWAAAEARNGTKPGPGSGLGGSGRARPARLRVRKRPAKKAQAPVKDVALQS